MVLEAVFALVGFDWVGAGVGVATAAGVAARCCLGGCTQAGGSSYDQVGCLRLLLGGCSAGVVGEHSCQSVSGPDCVADFTTEEAVIRVTECASCADPWRLIHVSIMDSAYGN